MAISYVIDPAGRIIRTTLKGTITDEDLRLYRERIESDPEFEPRSHHLLDATGVGRIRVSAEFIRVLAASDIYAREMKRAIAVTGDEAYGLARMFQSLTTKSGENTRIFQDVEEAEAWIRADD